MGTVKVILFMIIFCFLLNHLPNTSYACSCAEPNPALEELESSSAVFSGKVIEIIDKNKNKSIQSSADPIAVLFEVEESWKGINQTEVVVFTERSSASCGFEFTLNTEYLVYAHETDGDLKVSFCSRTALLSPAHEDIGELGKGELPTEHITIDLANVNATDTNYLSIFLIIVALILVLGSVYITRRIKN